MILRKILKILFSLILVLAVTIGLTSINHPIILKWVTGSARHHGQPIPAMIYTNGQENENLKIYYTDEVNSYLLSMGNDDGPETLKFINLDLNEKSIGRPVENSKNDYDLIAGHLFQSKTAGDFIPLRDDTNGTNFEPRLTFTGSEIRFNLPPAKEAFDSVRIILP